MYCIIHHDKEAFLFPIEFEEVDVSESKGSLASAILIKNNRWEKPLRNELKIEHKSINNLCLVCIITKAPRSEKRLLLFAPPPDIREAMQIIQEHMTH